MSLGASLSVTGTQRRFDRLRRIQGLDPERDYEEIWRLVSAYEFPWDYWQSVSLAFFRTFAVPSISALLDGTGEIVGHTQKRADDTLLIMFEMGRLGLESPEGRAYLRRMNQMHRRYVIGNDDSIYIIALFIVVPVRWINRFGWRKLTVHEERAMTNYGRRLAQLMGIKDVPATFAAFDQFAQSYENAAFRRHRQQCGAWPKRPWRSPRTCSPSRCAAAQAGDAPLFPGEPGRRPPACCRPAPPA